jgi:hypothetical protein
MSEILKEFTERRLNSVEYRHAGGWPVYADYDLAEYEEGGKRRLYVVPSNLDLQRTWRYAPLREPLLFIEFAVLFDQPTASEEAAPTVLDWVKRYGVLGAHHAYSKTESETESRRRNWPPADDLRLKGYGTLGAGHAYPGIDSSTYSAIDRTLSGRVWSPPDDIQSVDEFVMHSLIANRCWRLLKAAKLRGGPDAKNLRELLRELGVEDDTPLRLAKRARSLVDSFLNFYLRRETCVERYRLDDGKSVRGPGFLSLLGALYLQMSSFRDAEDITYCKWCGEVVAFEEGTPPPSDAPRGARGKHKTHKTREYCKEKYGVKNYCKNQFNYARQRKAKAGS